MVNLTASEILYSTFEDFGYKTPKTLKTHLVLFEIILFVLPLALLEDIGKLGFSSLIAIIAIGYVIIVMIFELPYYIKHYESRGKIEYFIWDLQGILSAFMVLMLSFAE